MKLELTSEQKMDEQQRFSDAAMRLIDEYRSDLAKLERERGLLRAELAAAKKPDCVWEDTGDGPWLTACGITHEGDCVPGDTGVKFCCYCGGKIVAKPFEEAKL